MSFHNFSNQTIPTLWNFKSNRVLPFLRAVVYIYLFLFFSIDEIFSEFLFGEENLFWAWLTGTEWGRA